MEEEEAPAGPGCDAIHSEAASEFDSTTPIRRRAASGSGSRTASWRPAAGSNPPTSRRDGTRNRSSGYPPRTPFPGGSLLRGAAARTCRNKRWNDPFAPLPMARARFQAVEPLVRAALDGAARLLFFITILLP